MIIIEFTDSLAEIRVARDKELERNGCPMVTCHPQRAGGVPPRKPGARPSNPAAQNGCPPRTASFAPEARLPSQTRPATF